MTPEKQLQILVDNEETKQYGKGRSPGQDAFREFRRNKIAVGGVIFIILVVVAALFAPFFTLLPF